MGSLQAQRAPTTPAALDETRPAAINNPKPFTWTTEPDNITITPGLFCLAAQCPGAAGRVVNRLWAAGLLTSWNGDWRRRVHHRWRHRWRHRRVSRRGRRLRTLGVSVHIKANTFSRPAGVVCYASPAETGSASLRAMYSCFRASSSSRAFTFTVVAFAANERKWAAYRW